SPVPADLGLYEEVAGCFHAVADALAVLKQLHDEPDLNQAEFESSLDLLAEAQSALRIAIGKIDGPADSDQMQVFKWLKATAAEHWRLLAATVDELVSGGLPPSNRDLREQLVPVIDTMPELPNVPQGFQLVLREIDRFLSTCPPPKTAPITQRSAEVQQVARL